MLIKTPIQYSKHSMDVYILKYIYPITMFNDDTKYYILTLKMATYITDQECILMFAHLAEFIFVTKLRKANNKFTVVVPYWISNLL